MADSAACACTWNTFEDSDLFANGAAISDPDPTPIGFTVDAAVHIAIKTAISESDPTSIGFTDGSTNKITHSGTFEDSDVPAFTNAQHGANRV